MSVLAFAATLSLLVGCESNDGSNASAVLAPKSLQQLDDFYAACAKGEAEEVQSRLQSEPALANAATPETKDSPLMRAAEFSQSRIVEILLAHGANPNEADVNGRTALITASYVGDATTVAKLLAASANPNAADSPYGFTPLLNATFKGHVEVVKLLLAAGADANIRAKDGRSPLDIAKQHGSAELTVILSSGASGG